MDDATLCRRLAANLDGSFECLVEFYQDRLYRFALRLSGSALDAEEIVQDALVRAYGALRQYEAERIRGLALRPWLYQITLNVFRNRVRRRQVPTEPWDGETPLVAGEELPEETAMRREEGEMVGAAIAGLPRRYREALVLRHIEDLSYAEIAAVLDQPVGTVKANVHRGIAALRAMLDGMRDEVMA